ncbi:MAG: hypothetical protein ABIG61_11695 [Planctomycetota bacterium]
MLIRYLAVTVIAAVFLGGCESRQKYESPPQKAPEAAAPGVSLGLIFEPGRVQKYKVVTQTSGQSKHEKSGAENAEIKSRSDQTTIVFQQEILSVESDRSATAKITIEYLKLYRKSPGGVQIDFQSDRQDSQDRLLAGLIGQSYTIHITPSGQASVLDAGRIREIITAGPISRLASALLSDEAIAKRHSFPLPPADKPVVNVGDSWSRIENSPRESFQVKSFEKIYTLEQVDTQQDQRLGIVKMKAILSGQAVPGGLEEKLDLSGVDDTDEFTGLLVMDLDKGSVKRYYEKLLAEWIAAGKTEDQQQPGILTIGFEYLHSLEAID